MMHTGQLILRMFWILKKIALKLLTLNKYFALTAEDGLFVKA